MLKKNWAIVSIFVGLACAAMLTWSLFIKADKVFLIRNPPSKINIQNVSMVCSDLFLVTVIPSNGPVSMVFMDVSDRKQIVYDVAPGGQIWLQYYKEDDPQSDLSRVNSVVFHLRSSQDMDFTSHCQSNCKL